MSLVGVVLHDTYRIEEKLGAGGMGEVYRAAHLRLGRKLAIKVIRGAVESEESFARFRREAEVTGELGNPHIVQTIDFNQTEDGAPYIVMELLEGEDLATRLRRERQLGVESALQIVEEIGLALGAAHARGIVHRDLKPQNVFLCRQEDGSDFVKVLDFGISKVHGATSVVTQSQAVIGTPKYMAPEQAKGESSTADARADQFALAAMLYEMLTGTSPFEADSVPSVLYKVVHEQPPSIEDGNSEIGRELAAAIMRGLAKDRDDRYPSIAAFVAALRGKPLPLAPDGKAGRALPESAGDAAIELAATTPALAELGSASTAIGGPAAPGVKHGGTITSSTGAAGAEAQGTITSATGARTTEPTRARSPLVWAAWSTAGVLAVGATAWILVARGQGDTEEETAAAQPEPAAEQPSAPAPPAPLPPDAAATVAVRIVTTPPADRILVDGEPIAGDSFERQQGARYVVTVEKAGYTTKTLERTADASGPVVISLAPNPSPPAGKKPRSTTRRPAEPTPPPDARPAPADEREDGRFITDF